MLLPIFCVLLVNLLHVECLTMLRGQVVPRDTSHYGDNLAGTTLNVRIEDGSKQDATSTVLSERSVKLSLGRKFPIFFEIVFPKITADSSNASLIVSASIRNTTTNELLYTTDTIVNLSEALDDINVVTLKVVKIAAAILDNREMCNAPPESGNCYAYIEQYYYNPVTRFCEKFVYGGCGGNKNRFETEEECLGNCLPKTNTNLDKEPVCSLAKDIGPCYASILRYYYDSETNKCKEFNYGGCLGNENNFETYEACIKVCYDA